MINALGIKRTILSLALLWAVPLACRAAPETVELPPAFWQQPGTRIGIAMTPLPDVGIYDAGYTGLLGARIGEEPSGRLGKRLETLDVQRVTPLPERFRKLLADKGFEARLAPAPLKPGSYPRVSLGEEYAARDYAALGEALQVDALLVIDIQGIGMARTYVMTMPSSPPAGFFRATGQLIDLKTKKLLWQKQVRILRSARKDWNEPNYPFLTQKVVEAIDAGMLSLVVDFSWALK